MGRNADRLSQRLSAITAAQPLDLPLPLQKSKRLPRSEARKAVFRYGRVLFADGSHVACIVKDISPGGARVILEGNIALPPTFTLKIDQTGITKRARLAWQDETIAGMAFFPPG